MNHENVHHESFDPAAARLDDAVVFRLADELARAMTLQLEGELLTSRTHPLHDEDGDPARFDLLLGLLLIGLEQELDEHSAKGLWSEIFERFSDAHMAEDINDAARRLFLETARGILDHWRLHEDDDPMAAILRATADTAFVLPAASPDDHGAALEQVVEELRGDGARFLGRVQRIVRGEA